jgi:hypothetical protein
MMMNRAVNLGIAFIFCCGVSATKADDNIKRFIHPIAGHCTSEEQSSCDSSELSCMNTGIDGVKKISCCAAWKKCMNSVGCDTSAFRCE